MSNPLIITNVIHTNVLMTTIVLVVLAGLSWAGELPCCPQNQSQSQSQNTSSSSFASGGNATAYGGQGGAAYNKLSIKYEDKRDLPNIPEVPSQPQLEYRGPYKSVNEQVKPWTLTRYWNEEMINGFPQCGWNCDIEVARLKTYPPRSMFTVVEKPNSAKVYTTMVLIYARNPLEMWGTVARLALEYGAYEVVELAYKNIFANKSTGWNIGLGGGVTALSGGNDNFGGSVGGGTGVGSVTTGPVDKVHGAFIFYSL